MIITNQYYKQLTQSYFNRLAANGKILSSDEKQNWKNFTKQLNDLMDIKTQLVELWSLRSTQNIGAGSVYLGLKGYNGDLIASPTWETTGIEFDGSTQYGFALVPEQIDNITLATIFRGVSSGQTNFGQYFNIQANNTFLNRELQIGLSSTTDTRSVVRSTATSANQTTADITYNSTNTNRRMFLTSHDNATSLFTYRHMPSVSQTGTSTSMSGENKNRVQFSGRWSGSLGVPVKGMLSFGAVFSPNIDSISSDFYTIVKNTIGQGLSLP